MTNAVDHIVSVAWNDECIGSRCVGRLWSLKVELSKQVDSSNDVEVRWTGPGCFRKIGLYVIASVEGALLVEGHQCCGAFDEVIQLYQSRNNKHLIWKLKRAHDGQTNSCQVPAQRWRRSLHTEMHAPIVWRESWEWVRSHCDRWLIVWGRNYRFLVSCSHRPNTLPPNNRFGTWKWGRENNYAAELCSISNLISSPTPVTLFPICVLRAAYTTSTTTTPTKAYITTTIDVTVSEHSIFYYFFSKNVLQGSFGAPLRDNYLNRQIYTTHSTQVPFESRASIKYLGSIFSADTNWSLLLASVPYLWAVCRCASQAPLGWLQTSGRPYSVEHQPSAISYTLSGNICTEYSTAISSTSVRTSRYRNSVIPYLARFLNHSSKVQDDLKLHL